ncbi:hypothetical protein YC2023_120849 [Brassica napus]
MSKLSLNPPNWYGASTCVKKKNGGIQDNSKNKRLKSWHPFKKKELTSQRHFSVDTDRKSHLNIGDITCDCKSDNEKSNGDDKRSSEYSFVSALSMSGGDGDNSYSTNSLLQVLPTDVLQTFLLPIS